MADSKQLPVISRQVTELILAGSTEHAEEAISETAEAFGDLAVVAVLDTLEPQVAAMHLSSFDGGKLSLATLLISPKSWAESLAFFAATWSEDMIENEPEELTEALFTHVHGIIFSTDDVPRRANLLHAALSTDWGTTVFALLFSTAIHEIIELANDIHARGTHSSGQTTSDHDVIPLALEIARNDNDAWERVLFEIFPNWIPGDNQFRAHTDEDEQNDDFALSRSTHELLLRLRKQVPSKKTSATPKKGARPSLGEDIFA